MESDGTIGFVVISHRHPEQLRRLIDTLNQMYGFPPIACHHDLSQSPLDTGSFPANVRFLVPSKRTRWAHWSVVDAVLAAVRHLYQQASPRWFVLLSGADYPIRPAAEVICDLEESGADAYLDFRVVGEDKEAAARRGARNPELWLFETEKGQRLGWHRYLGAQVWIPWPKRAPAGGWRIGKQCLYPPIQALNAPYSRDFACFQGDFWFTGSRRAAEVLLTPTPLHRRLQRYLRLRTFPEESYFQTVLCNEPGLKLDRNNRRFAVWDSGSNHPSELTHDHLERMRRSDAHFARKFTPDEPVLDELDRLVT